MLISNLNEINEKAPSSGQLLAYTREKVYFEPYSSLNEVKEQLGSSDLLEIHLFDQAREYRAISTESSRYENGFIEHVAAFEVGKAKNSVDNLRGDVYVENCFPEKGQEKISVLSLLDYDEKSGMISIADYRLVMGGNQDVE